MGMSCVAIRRSALDEVGSYFIGISGGENPTELMFRFKKKVQMHCWRKGSSSYKTEAKRVSQLSGKQL